MKILSVTITGFGSHANGTTVEWDALGSLVAIQAPTGTGKSFLLDAAFAALYGRFPSQGGTIYDQMTDTGHEGTVSADILLDDRAYRIERRVKTTEKTQSHEATVWLLRTNGRDEIEAGPKVRDVDEWVARHVCSEALALASWHSPQGNKGDICSVDPAERRRLFGEKYGFDRYDKIARRASEEANALSKQFAYLNSQVTAFAVEGKREELARLRGEAETLDAQAKAAADRATEAHLSLDVIRAELEAAQTERATVGEAQRELEAAKEAERAAAKIAEQAATAYSLARAEVKRAIAEDQAAAERRANQASADHRAAASLAEERGKALTAAREAVEEIEAVRATAAELPAIKEQGRELKGRKDAFDAAEKAHEAAREAKEAALRAVRSMHDTFRDRAAELDKLAERAEARAANAPNVPGPKDVCETCPLMAETVSAAAEAKRDRERSAMLRSADADPENITDLLNADWVKNSAVERSIKGTMLACGVEEHAKADAAAHAHFPDLADPTPEIEALRPRYEAANLAAARLPQLERDAARVTELEAAHREASEALEPKAADMRAANMALMSHPREETAEEAERIRQMVADHEAAREAHDKALDACHVAAIRARDEGEAFRAAEAKIEAIRARIKAKADASTADDLITSECRTKVTRALTLAESLEQRIAEHEKQCAEAEALADRIECLKFVAEGFGPKGAQVLLLEQKIGEIEEETNECLRQVTGGRYSLYMRTQRPHKKTGAMVECFDIVMRDNSRGTERDLANYSGGEQVLGSVSLRLADAIISSRRGGLRMEQLFLDETLKALDSELAQAFVEYLGALRDRFSQIVLITHSLDLAATMPCVVRLRKTALGCEVVFSDNESEVA